MRRCQLQDKAIQSTKVGMTKGLLENLNFPSSMTDSESSANLKASIMYPRTPDLPTRGQPPRKEVAR